MYMCRAVSCVAVRKCLQWPVHSHGRMILVHFQGIPFNITVIHIYASTSNVEVQWFSENPQDLPELTPKKDVLFIIGDWNAKVGSQEIPGIIGKFGVGVQNETGHRLTDFCQENTLVIANTFLYTVLYLKHHIIFQLLYFKKYMCYWMLICHIKYYIILNQISDIIIINGTIQFEYFFLYTQMQNFYVLTWTL